MKGFPFSITEASLSDCFVSYPGHSLGVSYPPADIQSVYSVAMADWANTESTKFRVHQLYPLLKSVLVIT